MSSLQRNYDIILLNYLLLCKSDQISWGGKTWRVQGDIDDDYDWFDRITIFIANAAVTFTNIFQPSLSSSSQRRWRRRSWSPQSPSSLSQSGGRCKRLCTCSSGTQQFQFVIVYMLSIFLTPHCSLVTSSESWRRLFIPSSNFLPENTHQLCVVLKIQIQVVFFWWFFCK